MSGGWWRATTTPTTSSRRRRCSRLSNGFLGIRASFEEGQPAYHPATLLNGFHETWPIVYPESAYGFATAGQTILPVPDGTTIRLLVDEDPITCETTEIRSFSRSLDMRLAALDRAVEYQLADGRRLLVQTRRFVSLAQRHMACIRYEVTALDVPVHLVISSELATRGREPEVAAHDPRRSRALDGEVLSPEVERVDGTRVIRTYRTSGSGLAVAAGIDHDFDGSSMTHVRSGLDGDRALVVFEVDAPAGQPLVLTKWLAYHYGYEDPTALAELSELTLRRARATGYAAAFAEHERETAEFWERSEVAVDGPVAAQQALHFVLFTLLQASLRSEGHGVPAKGLTGTGYEGHYFWDTEAYVLPFLTHTSPAVARSLLMHRVRMLPDARRRARGSRLRRCPLSVAHDQRPRGVRLLRRRHRAVPHRRRHRLRAGPVRAGDRRRRAAVPTRRGDCSSRPRGCGPGSASSPNATTVDSSSTR